MSIDKKPLIVAAGLLLLLIIIYVAIIPTVVANHYLGKLDAQTAAVKSRLNAVAAESGLTIFADPDITLAKRQASLAKSMSNVHAARKSLDDLNRANMLSHLPGNGFVGDYHTAVVRQERAANIVRQSREVLDQYAEVLDFLNAYTGLQIDLDSRLEAVNKIKDFNSLAGQGRSMANMASHVRAGQKSLQSLAPPPDFEPLQGAAAETFGQTAAGFDQLARGLNRAVDSQIYSAVKELEAATDKNQTSDKDLLVSLAANSSVLRQLAELPEKVEHAQGR